MSRQDKLGVDSAFVKRVSWIWSSERTHRRAEVGSPSHYEVRRFRRSFQVSDPEGAGLTAHVTADSRYVLYINGHLVMRGPAKGDIRHHFFDSADVGGYLNVGENILAALVMDYSQVNTYPPELGAPTSVMTLSGGFLAEVTLQNPDGSVSDLSTDDRWHVSVDRAYRFHAEQNRYGGFVGYFEAVHAAQLPRGWTMPGFSEDRTWVSATPLYPGVRRDRIRDFESAYGLVPRMIPALDEVAGYRFETVFEHGGGAASGEWHSLIRGDRAESGEGLLRVSAGSRRTMVLDAGALQTGYPRVELSGGRGSEVRLSYAEALRLPFGTEGAVILGKPEYFANLSWNFADTDSGWTFDPRGTVTGWCDTLYPDGGAVSYQPFHWRTFRYILLEIHTDEEDLELHDVSYDYTAYPYRIDAEFDSSEPAYSEFWDIGIRTLRLCSHETFEDCPYYEQMQYPGDAVITSQLAMALAGDYDLTRQGISQLDWSRLPEGITQSRFPSREEQVIPSWSLHWITMITNYLLYSGDRTTARSLLRGIHAVLDWFRDHRDATGLPSKLPFWNNVDWCPWWDRGQPPGWDTGPTCIISSQFVLALREAGWIEEHVGNSERAAGLRREAEETARKVHATFWSPAAGVYLDAGDDRGNPSDEHVSQYAQAWAVYAGVTPANLYPVLLRRFPEDKTLAPASFFGSYYVMLALRRMGAANRIPPLLAPWHEMAASGLTTWAEETAYWRSLCHVWSAHPSLLFVNTVLGIVPEAPGCSRLRVAPHSMGLRRAEGGMCTPRGKAEVRWERQGDELRVSVRLPKDTEGRILGPDGDEIPIRGGRFEGSIGIVPGGG
jgi:hypothetical protein